MQNITGVSGIGQGRRSFPQSRYAFGDGIIPGMEILKRGAASLGLNLNPAQLERFETYYRELIEWNQRFNLTAITDYEEAQVKHFLDSLTIAVAITPDGLVLDVGTGAGTPGLPLKILYPDLKLCLLEATAKKTQFLDHVCRRLGLAGVEIITGRAEEVAHRPDYRERFDFVVARGLAPLVTLVELTLPFCRPGGCLIAAKRGDIDAEVRASTGATGRLGGRLGEIKTVAPEGLPEGNRLVIIDKVAQTPPQYPRRPGRPAKRPLTG